MSIYKKLSEFKTKVGAIAKDGANPFHQSKYATIESVLKTIEAPLAEVGIGFYQSVEEMTLKTVVYDTEGNETITSTIPLILSKNDMQQLGSAITYARRYGLVSIFGLEQEDDDANRASGYNNKQQAPKQQQAQATVQMVETLAKTKSVDISKICEAYKITTISHATSDELNKIYGQLLKK